MTKKDLRIIFMGTPEFAVESLKRLVEGGYNVVAVVTQPDKPVGRHQDTLQPSQVKLYAVEHGLPVLQPVKMKDPDFLEQLKSYQADLQVVVAFRNHKGKLCKGSHEEKHDERITQGNQESRNSIMP